MRYPRPLCNEAASLAQSSPQHKLPHEVGRINRDNHDQDTWDPLGPHQAPGRVGINWKTPPADHNQIEAASINLSPSPLPASLSSLISCGLVSPPSQPGHRP